MRDIVLVVLFVVSVITGDVTAAWFITQPTLQAREAPHGVDVGLASQGK